MGLNIDPKLRLDSEKTLKDGDSLMNVGKLKEALPYYEKVMDKLPFKIMTPKAHADIHINLPALKKLDSMLIVGGLLYASNVNSTFSFSFPGLH
ncbi:putative PRONE domain-containing protein [Rosa chinensis]|uniref:Putative PRONE domain-containing protein n=1 Tax=Rosa chinensis TaxID=74649 RepID=A0A2P6QSV6_ROSCH|nr:putative PRONE domain-containing protein [Rosa chinensis]